MLGYGSSKWAIRGLTQAAAMDLDEHNINVKQRVICTNLRDAANNSPGQWQDDHVFPF